MLETGVTWIYTYIFPSIQLFNLHPVLIIFLVTKLDNAGRKGPRRFIILK